MSGWVGGWVSECVSESGLFVNIGDGQEQRNN